MTMIDFSKLRGARGTNAQAMQKALDKTEVSRDDPNIWKYKRNADDLSINTIRFLPIGFKDYEAAEKGLVTEADLTPMAKVLRHNFQGANGWLNAVSPETFGLKDPIGDWSRPQWAGLKENKEDPVVKAKRDKLKEFIPSTEYYVNILVVNDAQDPSNNGKVFKFRFGEAIRKFVDLALNPKFPTDPKFDPFDAWEGANLELNLSFEKRKFGNRESYVPKFEAVKWSARAPIGDDEYIEKVWKESHALYPYYDRATCPSYDELKEQFCKVMNFDENMNPKAPGASVGKSSSDFLQSKPETAGSKFDNQPAAPAQAAPAAASAPAATATQDDEDELARLLRGD